MLPVQCNFEHTFGSLDKLDKVLFWRWITHKFGYIRGIIETNLNPRQGRGDGGDAPTPWVFLNGHRTAAMIELKFCISYEASIVNFLKKKYWPGQVRWRSYGVIRDTCSRRVFNGIVVSATELSVTDWNGDIMHDSGQTMTTSDPDLAFWPSFLGHWPWTTPYLPLVAKLAVLEVYGGPETEYVAHFSHRLAHSARSPYPIQGVCPQAIFPSRTTLFRSGLQYHTYAYSHKNTLTTRYFVHNWTGNTLVNVLSRYDY